MIPIRNLLDEHSQLVRKLHPFDFARATRLIATLSLFPQFAANTIRIEALLQIAAVACNGTKKPTREDLVAWVGDLGPNSSTVRMEDPVEDVFIGSVNSKWGSFRIFCGVIADPDFWIEQLLEFVDERTPFETTRREAIALLRLGDAVSRRLGLDRYVKGNGTRAARVQVPRWNELLSGHAALTFSEADLIQLDVPPTLIERFCLTSDLRKSIADAVLFNTVLDERPLVRDADGIIVIAPSCIGRAVSRHLVKTIASGMGGWADTFFQVETATSFVNDVLRKLDVVPLEFDSPRWPEGVPAMMPYFGQFDQDKAVIGLSFSSELTAVATDFSGTDSLNEKQQQDLEGYVRSCTALLARDKGLGSGLVLVNLAAIGRTVMFRLTRDIPNWHVRIAFLPDWLTLVNTAQCTAMRLWKLCEHEMVLHQNNIELLNLAGLVNLFAFWKRNNFQLIPRDVDIRGLNLYHLDCDFATAIRVEVRQSHDVHCVRSHKGDRWVRVMRHNVGSSFQEDTSIAIYADYEAVGSGQLIGYIPPGRIRWWLRTPAVPTGHKIRDLVYQLWDCMVHWLGRLAPIAERAFSDLIGPSIMIEVEMPDVLRWNLEQISDVSRRAAELHVSASSADNVIGLMVPEDFLRYFHTPKNVAETQLVDSLLTGAAMLAKANIDAVGVAALRREIIPNEDSRYFHIADVSTLEQMLAGTGRANPVFVATEDIAVARLGLADLGRRPADAAAIDGVQACREFLERVVEKIWERLEARLKPFDRASVVAGCFAAIDQITLDDEHWNMTARSLLAMHSDTGNVHSVVTKRRSERDKATVGNRLIIETAQYSCAASGGRLFNQADHASILGDMTVLVEFAHHRDAIAYGFMAPHIEIFPNGDLDFDERFYIETLGRYLTRRSEQITSRAAANYERYFSIQQTDAPPAPDDRTAKIDAVFEAEFNFRPENLLKLLDELREFSLTVQLGRGQISEADLRGILSHCGFSGQGADSFLDRFVLPVRRAWNADLPQRCALSDVFPWRHRRQLSLLTRPIVEITSSPRTFFVSVPQLEKSIAYWFGNLDDGHFPRNFFASEEMRRFVGRVAHERGHQFTQSVGAVFNASGYLCELEVEMTALDANKHAGLGDVDVLAWQPGSGRVFAVECKRLLTALSPREVIQRLEEFRGDREQKDSLGRHLRRVDWIAANRRSLVRHTGISLDRMLFTPLLVPSDIVPMQFFSEMKFPTNQVIPFDDLPTFLANLNGGIVH